jgi:hypothetical protein
MRKPDSPGAYRDELVAAQARVATLEEQLAIRAPCDDLGDDDPVIARLLEQQRELEQTANRRADWQTVLWIVLTPPVVVLVLVALMIDRANYVPVGLAAMCFVAIPEFIVLGLYFAAPKTARAALPRHDAKIAEARRLLAIERGLRAPAPPLGAQSSDS